MARPETIAELRKALPNWRVWQNQHVRILCLEHHIEFELWSLSVWYDQVSRSDKRRAILAAYRAAQAFERGK